MDAAGLRDVFAAALDALDPERLVAAALEADPPGLGPVTVLGLGKAAAGMARGMTVLDNELTGVVVTPEPAALPPGLENVVGSHPVPDAASVAAGEALLASARRAPADGLLICLLSGGGSALAEVPVAPLTIADVAAVTEALMLAGAAIEELNAVRVALSNLKGGGLAAAAGAPIETLAISDVAPLPAHVIASGPTLPFQGPDPDTVLRRYGLWDVVGSDVRRAIEAWQPRQVEAGKLRVLADGGVAAASAAAAIESAGERPVLASYNLAGEAGAEAVRVVQMGAPPGAVAVYWGETTVAVTGSGTGGRNHEAALAAAIELDGGPGVFLAAGTDGVDGSTTGAGAVVDGGTAAAGRAAGLDPLAFLTANDSGGFFDVVPGRIETGPTGTNVADLWLYSAS